MRANQAIGGTASTILVKWVRVLLMVSIFCCWGCAQTSTQRIREITSSLRARQFDQGLQLLQPELERSPRNPQLWALQGIAYSGKGDQKRAFEAFHHALDIAPEYLPALEGAAQIEYDTGGKDAEALLRRVLRQQPHDTTSHAMLAVLAYRRRDCASAVLEFELSGATLDAQPAALEAYGDCLVRLKETEKAITVFGRAVEQAPDDPKARYRLASLQMMAQHPKNALATLEPLLRTSSADSQAMDLAASAYEADGNTPDAVRILRQAIVSDPHNVNLYVDFANLSIDHQSYAVGVDMINAGLTLEPKSAPLYVARGILYVQMAQFDSAEADFEKADAMDPKNSIGSAAEGLAAVQHNDPDQALKTVRAKLARNPHDAFLLYLKAEIITQKGPEPGSAEFREAVDSARKAVSLRPSLAQARDILAKLYLQAGQNNLALEQSRQALKTDPKDQTALYHQIQALRKMGRASELPDLLRRLAELRTQGSKDEAEHNRYKLVEEKSPSLEKPQS
jgi:tetratricopeptide (TPR) repeat protein